MVSIALFKLDRPSLNFDGSDFFIRSYPNDSEFSEIKGAQKKSMEKNLEISIIFSFFFLSTYKLNNHYSVLRRDENNTIIR